MAHAVHTTEAIVLSSAGVQDADKLFWLLTEDFGLLFASAKSVREEVSKLRFALQDLSFTRVSLVRGKSLWRLVGAEECESLKLDNQSAKVFGRIATLVRRLMPSDEENEDLFTIIHNVRIALIEQKIEEEIIERIAVARILYRLGYLPCKREYCGIVDTLNFNTEICNLSGEISGRLISDINESLSESQL